MQRTLYKSKVFDEFYSSLNARTGKKLDFILQMIANDEIINAKFVKKLQNSVFYEIRISTDNEYRIVNFTMDDENFINATKILLLKFVKKSESDYKRQIIIAQNIMKKEEFLK